jgi:hypothetical protein
MSTTDEYKRELAPLVAALREQGELEALCAYLMAHSNLPGPRGNLELAAAFATLAAEQVLEAPEPLWRCCVRLMGISPIEAPVNDPREFLAFCGTQAIGAIGSVSSEYYHEAIARLRTAASDSRWRIREAVAMGLQHLLAKERERTLAELAAWLQPGAWLAMRAVAAGVAEPALLHDTQTARAALTLHVKIIEQLQTAGAQERTTAAFKTLRQGLGYSVSVVVAALPREGFAYLHQLAGSPDSDVQWILKENLKKARLTRRFPEEVDVLRARMGMSRELKKRT